ncbi:hypothetical protein CUJ83_13610 [Methanocella sp. CWC-04]|uniref:Glycosyltransferase subfamily 4-like N-terminal domain-containing protein n=1 Tax=Methanooceanicella nereidis TaxID=2052831 RepID=A0AAP2RH21_9EURY|nr:glycosyltransferase family 4 protein [Methanocella sp. CWC-04]MCD1296035.1 hypothetical protein [Methanocella sp. CWC-04]
MSIKILHVVPYGVYPPKSGGALRVFSLGTEMSKYNEVYLFAQGIRKFELRSGLRSRNIPINKNYMEYRYVNILSVIISYISGKISAPPVFAGDILNLFGDGCLDKWIKECDLIQVEHPWQFDHIYSRCPENVPLVLVEQNVEYNLFSDILNDGSFISKKILKNIYRKEKFAVENADAIFVVSRDDKDSIMSAYGIDGNKIHVIPNGVDTIKFYPATSSEKADAKERLGLTDKKVILFTGSAYGPNYDAIGEILKISGKIKRDDIAFLVVGRAGERFNDTDNVTFTGLVDDISVYFKAADMAINPMVTGGGTNLKVLEYLSAGLPTISTGTGARGLEIENGKDILIAGLELFPDMIIQLLDDERSNIKLKESGRESVVKNYDWKVIAKKQNDIFESLIGQCRMR